MSLNVRNVGLPNRGKSTLFNALTKRGSRRRTIRSVHRSRTSASSKVPDLRPCKACRIAKPQKVTPRRSEFVDIAGLVAGASKGEGLATSFLANIRECDAIGARGALLRRSEVVHVADDRYIETMQTELRSSDLARWKGLRPLRQVAKTGGRSQGMSSVDKGRSCSDLARPARSVRLSKESNRLNPFFCSPRSRQCIRMSPARLPRQPRCSRNPGIREREAPVVPDLCALERKRDPSRRGQAGFLADMGMKEPASTV